MDSLAAVGLFVVSLPCLRGNRVSKIKEKTLMKKLSLMVLLGMVFFSTGTAIAGSACCALKADAAQAEQGVSAETVLVEKNTVS